MFRIYGKKNLNFTEEQIETIIEGSEEVDIVLTFEEAGYSMKEEFFHSDFKQMALACTIIAKSMHAHLNNPWDWDDIKGLADEFATKIEGRLTKEGVLEALQWDGDCGTGTTKDNLIRWINECDLKDLEMFVMAVTGSTTLSPGRKLTIVLNPTPSVAAAASADAAAAVYFKVDLPAYHTCVSEMHMPDNYGSYNNFVSKLERCTIY